MPTYCCVPQCKQFGNYQFPRDQALMRLWCIAIKRVGPRQSVWKPSPSSKVCAKHFLPTDFEPPCLHFGQRSYKKLKAKSIPSVFSFKPCSPATPRSRRYLQREENLSQKRTEKDSEDVEIGLLNIAHNLEEIEPALEVIEIGEAPEVIEVAQEDPEFFVNEVSITATESSLYKEVGIQAEANVDHVATQTPKEIRAGVERFGIDLFENNPEAVDYYTGFNDVGHFNYFFNCLGPAANDLLYQCQCLSRRDELFLTLVKLRRDKDDEELGILFKICRQTVSKVFHTWLNFLYFQVSIKNKQYFGRINM